MNLEQADPTEAVPPAGAVPGLLPAVSGAAVSGAAVSGVGGTAAARTAGAWDLLWELHELSSSWGLGSKFTSYD